MGCLACIFQNSRGKKGESNILKGNEVVNVCEHICIVIEGKGEDKWATEQDKKLGN